MSHFASWSRGFAVPAEHLSVFRVVYAAWTLATGVRVVPWVGDVPPALFKPPPYSLGALLASAPPTWVLDVLSAASIALLVLLLFGVRTRATSLALFATFVVLQTLEYSFGKIDHHRVFFTVVPIVFAFSSWGSSFSWDAARRGPETEPTEPTWADAWPVALFGLIIALGFVSAGVGKAAAWIDFDLTTQGARNWLLGGYFVLDRQDYLAPLFLRLDWPYLWEGMDMAAVVFELGALPALLAGARWFRRFAAVAISFHIANHLILNIDFLSLWVVYVVFAPEATVWIRSGKAHHAFRRVVSSGWCFRVVMALHLGVYGVVRGQGLAPARFSLSLLAFEGVGLDASTLLDLATIGLSILAILVLAWPNALASAEVAPARHELDLA